LNSNSSHIRQGLETIDEKTAQMKKIAPMAVQALSSFVSLRKLGKGKNKRGKKTEFWFMGNWEKRYFIVGLAVFIVALLAFLLGLQM